MLSVFPTFIARHWIEKKWLPVLLATVKEDVSNINLRYGFPGLLSRSRPGGAQKPESASTRQMTFTFRVTIGGIVTSIQINGNALVAQLKRQLSRAMDATPCQLQLAVQNDILKPDSEELCKIKCLQVLATASEVELTVVQKTTVTAERHIYTCRGGRPPYCGSYLTATEDIELNPCLPLCHQWAAIVPGGGMDGFDDFGVSVYLLDGDGKVPNKWEGDTMGQRRELWFTDFERRNLASCDPIACHQAGGVFADCNKSLVVLIPMRDCD